MFVPHCLLADKQQALNKCFGGVVVTTYEKTTLHILHKCHLVSSSLQIYEVDTIPIFTQEAEPELESRSIPYPLSKTILFATLLPVAEVNGSTGLYPVQALYVIKALVWVFQ